MTKKKPMHFKKHYPWGKHHDAGTFGVAVGKFKKELKDYHLFINEHCMGN